MDIINNIDNIKKYIKEKIENFIKKIETRNTEFDQAVQEEIDKLKNLNKYIETENKGGKVKSKRVKSKRVRTRKFKLIKVRSRKITK